MIPRTLYDTQDTGDTGHLLQTVKLCSVSVRSLTMSYISQTYVWYTSYISQACEGRLPLQVVFYQRSSSIKCRLPSKVSSSSIKVCLLSKQGLLPSKVICHRRLSFIEIVTTPTPPHLNLKVGVDTKMTLHHHHHHHKLNVINFNQNLKVGL